MTEKLRIVFMNPDFAVGILTTILQNNYNVVGNQQQINLQDAVKNKIFSRKNTL
jgi:hypothetical protein